MEEKRRLPSWMLGASTTNKVSKPLDADASSVVTSEEVSVVTKSIKPKAKGVNGNRKKEVCVSSDKNMLVKCETKRRKRRLVEKDVIECRDPDQEVGVQKRKGGRVRVKSEESGPARKENEKSFEFDGGNNNLALSCDEEDDDLTMDDVLSIAKEVIFFSQSICLQFNLVICMGMFKMYVTQNNLDNERFMKSVVLFGHLRLIIQHP